MSHITAASTDAPTRAGTVGSRRLHTTALIAALAVSAVAFADAVTLGLTGENLVTESSPASLGMLGSGLVHGFAYVVLGWLLIVERRAIDGGSRVRAVFRWALTSSYALLTPFFLVGVLQAFLTDATMGELPVVYEVAAGLGFAGMFLSALALGFALWRIDELRPASRVLSLGLLAGFGCTIAFAFLAPDWSHPAYPETAVYVGTALLAFRRTCRPDS